MAQRSWLFICGARGIDGATWYERVIEHGADLDPPVLADALTEMAWLAVAAQGDPPGAAAFAERSLSLAERHGVVESPYAWLAKCTVAFYTTRSSDGLTTCERAVAAAEARHDDYAAVTALGMLGNWLVEFGDAEHNALSPQRPVDGPRKPANP